MPYSYHESTKLSQEDALALKSLAATGELPSDHYWNTLRTQHDANPTRFDKNHNYVIGALLNRDEAQRQGTLGASAPLLSNGNSGFFAYAGAKHTLNIARFDHWHPFLGRLFEITLPTTAPAGEGITSPPITTPGNLNPSGSDSGGGGGGGGTPPPDSSGGGGGGTGTPIPNASVPEPASALLTGLALLAVMAITLIRRRTPRPAAASPAGA